MKITLDRSPSYFARGTTALLFVVAFSTVVPVEARTRAVQRKTAAPKPAARPVSRPKDGALALLGSGITAQIRKQPADAVRDLRAAGPGAPKLADYAAYYLAAAEADLGDFSGALRDLEPLWSMSPPSPLAGDAALLAARAYKESGKPAEGVEVLRTNYARLSQPAGDATLAACYRAANDLPSAAAYYQRVYYEFPTSAEAEQAGAALADLRGMLGALFPPSTSQATLQRADKLARAGDYRRARAEYETMISDFAGPDRDVARVRIGVIDFLAANNTAAYNYLRSLVVSGSEADAERLYYLAELARRMDRDDQLMDAVRQLERYPKSTWRMKALVAAGNRYLLENRAESYVPLFRSCYESFPEEAQADYCHWKVTWNAYLHRQPESAELLREHLVKFPGSERSSAALYFLGRLAEAAGQPDAAKAYYTEITDRFPNHYYADVADNRLTQPSIFRSVSSASISEFLKRVVWPVPPAVRNFEPTPATSARLDRARLLDSAGLPDFAETELRFGARTDGQPHVVAIKLAQSGDKYGEPHRALRLVKSLVPGYLSLPLDSAPAAFWRLLYPMPWRSDLERNARQNGLDPYIVAGLIRQESEFNPEAVSSAQAYGLTQLLPSTGRGLMKASRRRFRPSVLFRPDLNLRLGTTYLRHMYDNYSGRWELTLASYNAGGSRVQNWLTWAEYREPAEFIETIPFSETRNYVFAVLRNASIYRKLYSPDNGGALAGDRLSPPIKTFRTAAVSSSKKKASFRRNPVVTKRHHASVRRHHHSKRKSRS